MMLKNLRWLAPMGLICAAGAVAHAEARLVVRNVTGRPWRLMSLQDTPAFTLHRYPAGAGKGTSETKAPRWLDEIRVGALERVELQWTDSSVPAQTLRFALLDEHMTGPDGTVLAFTWEWKGEGAGSVAALHPQQPNDPRFTRCQDAIATEGNVCSIQLGSYQGPSGSQAEASAGAGAGSGSGADAIMAARLPMGAADNDLLDDLWAGPIHSGSAGSLTLAGGAGAGAGAGSGAGLPTGPAPVDALMAYETRERAFAARSSQSLVESKGQAGSGRLRVGTARIDNTRGVPFKARVEGATDGSFRQDHAAGHGAGDLAGPLPVPAGSDTTLTLALRTPDRVVVRLVEDVTPERAAEYEWRLGASPAKDGRSPADLRRVDDSKGRRPSATGAIVRKGGPGVLVIESFDGEAEAGLVDSLARLVLAQPDAAPRRPAGMGGAKSGHREASGGVGDHDNVLGDYGLVDSDGIAEEDIDEYLDLTAVAAGGEQADDAVARFLDARVDLHPNFLKRRNQLAEQVVQALTAAGITPGVREPAEGIKAGIPDQPAVKRLDRQYEDAGMPLLKELLKRQVDLRELGLEPADPGLLENQLKQSHRTWRRRHLTWALGEYWADAAPPASAGAGAGSGSGSGPGAGGPQA